jgi:hypothetical protein
MFSLETELPANISVSLFMVLEEERPRASSLLYERIELTERED